jgi:hypothetical protein
VELEPGEMAYVRREIAHRMNGGKGFLRKVFYARQLLNPKALKCNRPQLCSRTDRKRNPCRRKYDGSISIQADLWSRSSGLAGKI